ncbi:CRISPR-associated protein Cas5 [Granulicella sp. S190]|uniref:CRISPR-associated protein Cas5 n=1 Tax=Granulicella sp. S190 TaxID=1747226 RepID=UPI00131D56A3|nr:CRISPR-associated protein Cas5 [Granulicella sp. S190]
MPNVHGIEFNPNQSELVKDLVRELLKDGGCVVYALNNMKPSGELRMAPTPPTPSQREVGGVFLRIRPGINQATIVRPMNAKAGEPLTKLAKITQAETLEMIRIWRKETKSGPILIKSAAAAGKGTNPSAPGQTTQAGV